METVKIINYVIMVLFFICSSYQFAFIPIALFGERKPCGTPKYHRYAVLIAARNEETVIGELLDSLKAQTYPHDMIDIFVAADNCDDNTAEVAAEHGAAVFERFDKEHIGKGYALKFLFEQKELCEENVYDAYIVFDADNIVATDFIYEMNKIFSLGFDIVTCCRNSKNYGDNWISAGYSLWFLRESKYLNLARYNIGSSCAVSGTGFLFSDKILKRCGGWKFFCLTEDIEFTIHNVVNGIKIGYCRDAVLYDEQPTLFSQSWKQRKRWAKGYMQVLAKYWRSLLKGVAKGSFSCFDMIMNIMSTAVLSMTCVGVNLILALFNILNNEGVQTILLSVAQSAGTLYMTLFLLGLITVISEWHLIMCPARKKILYTLTFPLFMFTYIPICISAIFTKTEWQPIEHTKSIGLSTIKEQCR